MLDPGELEAIELEIKELDQEMVVADKRLERFKQAAAEIKQRNRQNLEAMGISSFTEVETMIKDKGVHPEGVALFKDAMAKKGKQVPDFLEKLGAAKQSDHPGETAQEPVKKKKRLRIRL